MILLYHLHVCILHITIATVYSSNQPGIFTEYILLQDNFQDRLVSRFFLYGLTTASKMVCAVRCMEDHRCVSFTYKRSAGTCRLLGISFSDSSRARLDPGTRLFYLSGALSYIGFPCTTNSDCKVALSFCNAGVCDCQIGYSFSVNARGCVRHCSTYGNDFTPYVERGIADNNVFRDWGYSEEACLNLCTSQTSYLCLTVERYPADGFCTVTNVTWFDVKVADRDMAAWGYIMYHRNCGV